MNEWKVFKKLLPVVKFYPWAFPIIIILGILSSFSEGLGISLFIPFLQTFDGSNTPIPTDNWLLKILSGLFNNLPRENLSVAIPLCIFATILLKNLLLYSNTIVSSWLYLQVSHRLISGIFKQLFTVGYSFIESQPSGKLLSTLTNDSWYTSDALQVLCNIAVNICTIFVFLTFLLLISWKLTCGVTIALIFISLIVRYLSKSAESLGKSLVKNNKELSRKMTEGLYAMKMIRSFGREEYEQKEFEKILDKLNNTIMKVYLIKTMTPTVSEILAVAVLVGILILSLQNQSPSSLPSLLTFIFILYRLQPTIKNLDALRTNLSCLIGSVDDVMYLLANQDKPYVKSGELQLNNVEKNISFDKVCLQYQTANKYALQDVSFQIPVGKTTAIVGPSGGGKSSLINLLMRLYDVTKGEIYVDNYPLTQLNINSWRNSIAIVNQDIYVFSTTIRDNILYGRFDATEEEVIAAAKCANAHEFITQLPDGYDTIVGDRGATLSGGQRQRIALARAIIRNPEILILDEATNALDTFSEHLIQEAINNFSHNRTLIVIAHRLSTIEKADQIIVVDQGNIVEQGNLKELLQLNGLFAKLHKLQFSTV
ncbi:MAG: ABC transporter ATP-binding protein/permease [Scytonematopsis contorta HA4267-MV1]|jgi:subfamily B ATP-binding cassette protein MsbA|nr:ABC transporter ATP-binding protein/permease [Scytonematopsis contorta HA4267-MV1]